MPEFPKLTCRSYDAARPDIRSGDILLASGEYMFSKIIQRATGSVWSHAAFVMRLDQLDRVMVLESIEDKGVRTIPLSEYVKNFEGTGTGYKGRIALARHARLDPGAPGFDVALTEMAKFAVDRFGRPYDSEEIARITAKVLFDVLPFGKKELKSDLKRNEVFICSEYVFECYKRLGISIEYDRRGFVTPANIADDPDVRLLFEIKVRR